jgi:hypothetical protein
MMGRPRVYWRLLDMVDTIPSNSNERIPHHSSALLRNQVNIRKIYLLRRGPQVLHHQGSRVTRQIMLPRVTSPKRLSTTPPSILSQPTTPKSPSTTRLRMLPQSTTPRLQLISMPKRSSTTPNRTSTTLPRSTQPQLRDKYYVAQTYNTAAAPSYYVELKYYTEAPVYYTTTYATPRYYDEAPTTTPKRPHITQPRTLPKFTTLMNPSITLLQATTNLRLCLLHQATEYYNQMLNILFLHGVLCH